VLIYKEELPTDTLFNVRAELPFSTAKEARKAILKLDMQYDRPVFWYQADAETGATKKKYNIIAIGTGHDWENKIDRDEYIGTLLLYGGSLVLHYFLLEMDRVTSFIDLLEDKIEKDYS